MHTHPNPIVMATPSGQPFRPSAVIAAQRGKSADSLRIVIETGEVITDRWASEDDATTFLQSLNLGMQGISDARSPRDAEYPHWATPANAVIAAEAVLKAGGTRERAARAYALTLLGDGEPASAIDAESMEAAWDEAVQCDMPVWIIAGMPNLARLALVAVEMGIDPSRIRFAEPSDIDTSPVTINGGVALTIGEDSESAFAELTIPRKVYSYCPLNDTLFGDWVGHGGPAIKHQHAAYAGRWEGTSPAQISAMQQLIAFFQQRGYSEAAKRLSRLIDAWTDIDQQELVERLQLLV
jgi:hypothetical protein